MRTCRLSENTRYASLNDLCVTSPELQLHANSGRQHQSATCVKLGPTFDIRHSQKLHTQKSGSSYQQRHTLSVHLQTRLYYTTRLYYAYYRPTSLQGKPGSSHL